MDPDRVIGRDGALPWHLPEDLAFFKRTTLGKPVVMGRKTFESIGKPLPKRRNIVLTRDPSWSAPGIEVIHQPTEIFSLAGDAKQIFIIGGAEIFAIFADETDELLISHVREKYHGDTWFPPFTGRFHESEIIESHADFEVRRWTR